MVLFLFRPRDGAAGARARLQRDRDHCVSAWDGVVESGVSGKVEAPGSRRVSHSPGSEMASKSGDTDFSWQTENPFSAAALKASATGESLRVRYWSHTGVSARSKFGCSLKPCTRLRWTMTCLPWSTKIHGASSTTSFCASR